MTNDLGLPEPLVAACAVDDYDRGDSWRTVTELIGPARAAALYWAFPDQHDEEDVADCLHRLMGHAIHDVLKRAGTTGIRERRWYATIKKKRISGQNDYLALHNGLLSDYKGTSISTVLRAQKYKGLRRTRFEDWAAQLNSYAHLGFLAGYEITGIEAVVFLDGWSRAEAKRNPSYPQSKAIRIPFDLWDYETTQRYLLERVEAHLIAEQAIAQGINRPFCSDDEQWKDPPVWAGYRGTNQRATKLFASAEEAEASGLRVEFRPSLAKRCLPGRDGYCPVRTLCAARADGQFRPGDLGE